MTIRTAISPKKDKEAPKLPTMDELRKALPAHVFVKDPARSLRYLLQDLALLVGLYLVVPYVEAFLGLPGLIAWYFLMGFVGFALFVVGHDCGHGSFSDHIWLNDLCGHIAHAPLFSPYWPWQKSHRLHHQYTAHLEKDHGHPWTTRKDYEARSSFDNAFIMAPVSAWLEWIPVYLAMGLPDGSHFWPWSKLFTSTKDRIKCVVSGSLCFLCAYLALVVCDFSVYMWIKYYWIPVSFQGMVLVVVTYLQHHHEDSEVYEQEEWNYVRGQTQTVDRKYGFGLDNLMHNITDGHVAHHMFFTKIPHYNLLEATEPIKKLLEPFENTPNGYKLQTTYDFLLRYFIFKVKLDYLIPKSRGVLQFRIAGEKAGLEQLLQPLLSEETRGTTTGVE